ncbi:MAG: hypothetical protein NT027_16905 [Proteobacteria bacterium]|nr:hypothetical protein [Pseudomonadota bacterium]
MKETMPMGDFNALVEKNFSIVCGLLMSSNDPTCKSDVIQVTCAQGQNKLSAAIRSLMSENELSFVRENAEKYASFDAAIRKDFFAAVNQSHEGAALEKFTKAADRCLNYQKYKEAEEYEKLASTPEFKAKAKDARRSFWINIAVGMTGDLVQSGIRANIEYFIGKISSPNTAMTYSQVFFANLCSSAFDMVSGFAHDVTEAGAVNGCERLQKSGGSRAWSQQCLRSYSAVCSASLGRVDLHNFGFQSNSEFGSFLLNSTNIGLSGLCNAGGPKARASCGVINMAANQISQALRTGDNDLAQCVGTSLAGACLGEIWGRGGWKNDRGVEVVRLTKGADKLDWRVRDCCHCRKDIYRSMDYAPDPRVQFENWMGVIQSGDFKGGNCDVQNGVKGQLNNSHYYVYKDCKKVTVVGASCSLESTDENGKLIDESRLLWDANKKSIGEMVEKKIRL